MNQITKRQIFIGSDSMDAVSYFQFIVKEGGRHTLISSSQLESLQLQIVELLAEQFERRTGGQSSSVSVETGQRIQQSVFYTIGYFLKSMRNAEAALETLKETALKELFLNGKNLVKTDFQVAYEQLQSIQKDRFPTDIISYNDTVDVGLSMFFRAYDMDFEAHETPASIDYPLSGDNMNLCGVEYITDYLMKLKLENEFCRCFSNEEIHCLLRGYDRQYKELLINVCDLVLANAAGVRLLGRNEISLTISDQERKELQHTFSSLPEEKIGESVNLAVDLLCSRLCLSGSLKEYLKISSAKLRTRLVNTIKTDSLELLFLPMQEKAQEPVIQFEDKAEMNGDSFRKLADEIRECRYVSDKILLLQREPLGISDLTGLLEGSCFFENEIQDEFLDVFETLEDVRLALLVKKLPLEPDGSGICAGECSREWQASLSRFLDQLDPGRKSAILSLAERIETL